MIEDNVNGNTHLPAVSETCRVAAPMAVVSSETEPEPEAGLVPLSHYLWILRRHRWKILASIVVCVLGTTIVTLRLMPIYEATATIDIDRRVPTGIIGQEAMQSSTNDADQFMATQMKLIQSDSVLRPVDRNYDLRLREKSINAPQPMIAVAKDAPVVLKRLEVTRPPNTYLLLISYRSPDRQLAADVANAIAQSYLEHTYNIRYKATAGLSKFMERQLEELKAKMEKSGAALLQFERELNVISPEEKTNIISARLLQLNTEYTNAQADRVKKEAAYTSVKDGTIEAAQVSTQGDALKKLSENLSDAQQKFVDIKTHYGANHPEYKKAEARLQESERQVQQTKDSIRYRVEIEYAAAQNREAILQKAVGETKAEFDRLNARSFEYQRLKQEAETDKKLYEELTRKIKEAGINASFQNSSIRIADLARPGWRPVFPNIPLTVGLAFLFSTLLSIGAAVVSDALDYTIRDPEQVARMTRSQVLGSLPMMKNWRGQTTVMALSGTNDEMMPAGASERYLSVFDEAIRTLRNSILLTDFDRRLRSVMITSASPSEGKSTIAAHLAVAHAQYGRKTLLIDGDLRRPNVHRYFNIPSSIGLSNVLAGDMTWGHALTQHPSVQNLDILPAGPPSRRATELIGTHLMEILEHAGRVYDLIVLDSPPLLGFHEPLQMATVTDGILIVALAGRTHRKALGSALGTLTRLRANVVGVVLNQLQSNSGNGYYYHHYYSKYYKRYQQRG